MIQGYHILDHVISVFSVVPFIVIPFFLLGWIQYLWAKGRREIRWPQRISTIFFVVPILANFALTSILAAQARLEVQRYLVQAHDAKVSIDGKQVRDSARVLQAFRGITWIPAHHSHPIRRISVVVRSEAGDLTLDLGRDSQVPEEYWVFYPAYHATSNSEIDRIASNVFNSY